MQTTHRRKLNLKQLDTLEILYRFRFVTTGLLTKYEGRKHITVAYSRLRILQENGYIGRHYNGDKQIRGEYATYYIKQKGVSALKDHLGEDFVSRVGKNLARDENATEMFVGHWLQILDFCCTLKKYYPSAELFTRTELAHEKYNYFINPLPDGYATIGNSHFFLDYIDASALYFKLTKRVKEYVAYKEEGKWSATGTAFPAVVLLCASSADQKRLLKKLPFMAQDIQFYTVVADDLTDFSQQDKIFTSVDAQASLDDIIYSSVADA